MFLFCGQILDEKSYPQYTDVQSSHKRRSLMPDNAQSSANGDSLRGNPYIAREHVILNPTDPNYGGRPIPRICDHCVFQRRVGTTKYSGCWVAHQRPLTAFQITRGPMPEQID